MQHEIPHRIHAEDPNQIIRIDHVTTGLTHLHRSIVIHCLFFLPGKQQPGMSEDLFRKRNIQRHQHDGPIDRMEPENVLADQMQICRPVFPEQFIMIPINIIAQTCNIVGKGIDPDIDHMIRIKIHRDPPLERRSGDTQILQSRLQEIIHHLVLAGFGLYKLRMGLDMLDQPVGIFAHLEEIGLFFGWMHLRITFRAAAILNLHRCVKCFAFLAVHPFVRALVNVALVIQSAEDLLYNGFMIGIRRTDKPVIGCIHQIPDPLHFTRRLIYKLLR